MGLFELFRASRQSLEIAKQAAEVTRLLGHVYALPQVDRRDVIEFVKINQMMLAGWATAFDLTVWYLICRLDIADRSDPRVRQMAENWIAATELAAKQGAMISESLCRLLAGAARASYGVDAEDVVIRQLNGGRIA